MAPRKTELECQWQTLSLKEPIFLRQMLIHPHPINRVTTVSDHQPARRYFLWELLEIQIYFVCCFFFNMFYRAELFQLKWLYSSRQGNPHRHRHTLQPIQIMQYMCTYTAEHLCPANRMMSIFWSWIIVVSKRLVVGDGVQV